MLPPFKIEQAINQIVREEWGRILAALVASIGDLQLAEDVLQDAVEQALTTWQQQGLPRSPAAWLITTSKRRAIDKARRDSRFAKLQPELRYLAELDAQVEEPDENMVIPDKRLELIFTCCHPALEEKSRIALTLRTLGGLTTEEIAKTFLDKPKTMAQRLSRAKNKISVAGIPFKLPDNAHLQQRLTTVLSVIYFIFNEGYSASTGQRVVREDLADEAIRLARIVYQLMPEQTEVAGLLALMLLHDSRRFTRTDSTGKMISLADQNRELWDSTRIKEGTSLLKATLAKQQVGPYQLQAAISAIHAESISWSDTDWQQISAIYELLYATQPSPVVRVNQSVAFSYAYSAEEALALLATIENNESMLNYQPFYAARADLHIRTGQRSQARADLKRAIELSHNTSQIEFLEEKLTTI